MKQFEFSKENLAKMIELHRAGMPLREIANELGTCMSNIQHHLTRNNAKLSSKEKEIVRFWKKVKKSKDGCWEWTGAATPFGHGRFRNSDGEFVYAHRYSWECQNGKIQDGLHVAHHCDNPRCVRPDHLFLATHIENMHDRDAKGRNNRGKIIHQKNRSVVRIGPMEKQFIKEHYQLAHPEYGQKALGKMFGVDRHVIAKIVKELGF